MNNFQWRTDLNEVIDLGDKVNYKIFSDGGEEVELTFDNVNYMKPNTQKDGVYGWDITLSKDGKQLQDFWIKQWGCLAVPYGLDKNTTTEATTKRVPNEFDQSDGNIANFLKLASGITDEIEKYKIYDKYRSFIRNVPQGELCVRLEFPSNPISYHKRKEQGTIIYSTVSLYRNDILLIEASGEGSSEGDKPFGNNHGCYFLLPEDDANYRVVISNDSNNGKGDESWILATCIRQDELSPSPYQDFGNDVRLEKGQHTVFNFSTRNIRNKPSGLIKINNVSR